LIKFLLQTGMQFYFFLSQEVLLFTLEIHFHKKWIRFSPKVAINWTCGTLQNLTSQVVMNSRYYTFV